MQHSYNDILFYDTVEHKFVIEKYPRYINPLNSLIWHGRNIPEKQQTFSVERSINDFDEMDLGENKSIIFAKRYSPHNAAHLFCETAIPIEHRFNESNVLSKNRIVIFNDDCHDDSIFWFEGDSEATRNLAQKHSENILSPLGRVIYNFKEFAARNTKKRYIKFKNNLILGIGGISPWSSLKWDENSIGKTLNSFAKKTYEYYNVEPKTQDTLTFIFKDGRSSILNHKELSNELKNKAIKNKLKYEYINLAEINFKQQLEILSRTKVLFSVGGASAFCCFLIPHEKTQFLYFPIKENSHPFRVNRFEPNLFASFADRFDFTNYESLKKNWQADIQKEDNSFVVDLTLLDNYLIN